MTVQKGSTSLSGTTTDVTISSVDISKSYVIFSARNASGANAQYATAQLINGTTLRFTREDNTGTLEIEWFVITDPLATVQRGTTAIGSGNTTETQAISSVDLSKSFITISHRTNESNINNDHRAHYIAKFNSNTEIEFERGESGAAGTVAWEVVTISDAVVQHGVNSVSGSSGNQAITAVDLDHAFVIAPNTTTVSNLESRHVRTSFNSTTQIDFNRVATSGTPKVGWFVVECERYNVQPVTSGNVTTQTVNVSITSVDTDKAFTVGTSQNNGTGTSNANSKYTLSITSATNWRRQKESTNQPTHVDGFVVEVNEPTSEQWQAQGNGEVTDDGGADITRRGFVVSTSPITDPGNVDPDTLGLTVVDESGTFGETAFDLLLSDLDPDTTYYTRAFAENSGGFSYGAQVDFETSAVDPDPITKVKVAGTFIPIAPKVKIGGTFVEKTSKVKVGGTFI